MMTKIQIFFNRLIGKNKNFETDELLLISILIGGFLLSVIGFIIDLGLHLNPFITILTGLSSLLLPVIYWFARVKRFFTLSKWLAAVVVFMIIDPMWFYNSGSKGPILLLLVLFFSLFIYLWDGWARAIFIAFFFLNSAGQFIIEYNFPHLLTDYANDKARTIDIYSGFLMYLAFSCILMIYIKQLYRAEKEKALKSDQLKSAFLANISHEIRTPLNGIIGFSQLLKQKELVEEKREKYISTIINCSDRLVHIVNDILDISSLQTGQVELYVEPIHLNKFIDQLVLVYKPKAEEKQIDFLIENNLNEENNIILTDGPKLWQIFNNLLSNAFKFTNSGFIKLHFNIKNNSVEFAIEDTGIGIPDEFHDKIFEQFRQVETTNTRHYGGNGLGLAICKYLIDLLSGKIWIESEVGKGSTFHFSLEKQISGKEASIQELKKDNNSKNLILNDFTVLIAEDEITNYLYLEEVLKDNNIKVVHAHNGLEAVNICLKNSNINLVLMDLKMPLLDGYSARKKIKVIKPKLPIVAQTAYAHVNDRRKAMNEGFDDYISKPIKLKEIQRIIEKYRYRQNE